MKAIIFVLATVIATSIFSSALEVDNERSGKVKIEDEKNTLVCAMATWCPHSRVLESALNTPELKKATSHLKIIYIYTDEWPTIKTMLEDEHGKEEGAKKYEKMKEDAAGSIVFDSAFLKEIRRPYYFLPKDSDAKPESLPTVYDFKEKRFEENPYLWLIEHANIDKDIVMNAVKKAREAEGID